ncbi:hypothetical protein PS15m_002655 [Mucor circinelloides]
MPVTRVLRSHRQGSTSAPYDQPTGAPGAIVLGMSDVPIRIVGKELLETTNKIANKLIPQIQLLKWKDQLRKESPVHTAVERAIPDGHILIVQ